MFDIAAICLVLTALLAYLNHRFVGMPPAIGVMAGSMALSLALAGLDAVGVAQGLLQYERSMLRAIDFSDVLMQGMLSLLLFAGALHVDLRKLEAYRRPVAALAMLGTVLSTLVVGYGTWLVLPLAGLQLPLMYCLLFGALISPTDPIAVMAILRSAGVPKDLELVITGESLFNDGVGVVLFSLLLGVLASGLAPTAGDGVRFLVREAGGGVLFGLVLGDLTFRLLRSVDNYQVEVLLTLAAVMGGYALARQLHLSGPLAMVVVGLMVGNEGRRLAMSRTVRSHLDMFWALLAALLNAVLFVLIGMQVLLVVFSLGGLVAAGLAVAVTLLARLATVGLPVALLRRAFDLPPGSWQVLTWGGLRGGLAVALALSLAPGPERETVVALTYCVVVFSILVQGLSIGAVTRRAIARP